MYFLFKHYAPQSITQGQKGKSIISYNERKDKCGKRTEKPNKTKQKFNKEHKYTDKIKT